MRAVSLDGDEPWAHLVLGLGHSRRRRPERAVTHLSNAISLNPSFALAYAGLGYEATLKTFFDDLPVRIAEAHVVISRSGASSVSEILVLARPAPFVPYRSAADDHQRANPHAIARVGAAWLLRGSPRFDDGGRFDG